MIRETEAQFQEKVVALAELCGWCVQHTYKGRTASGGHRTNTTIKGWPDLELYRPDASCPGLIHVELKTDTGTLSPAQRITLANLVRAGAEVYIWRPRDWEQIEARLRRPRR